MDLKRLKKYRVVAALLAGALVVLTVLSAVAPPPAPRPTPVPDPTAAPLAAPAAATPASAEERQRETRALWVSRWDFAEHPDPQAIVDRAAEAHLNVIFFQVRGQADAMYPSSLEPWAGELGGSLGQDPGWDPLAELISAAHAKDIEVHAWLNVYPVWMGSAPPPASTEPQHMYHDFTARYGQDWLLWQGSQPMSLGGEGYLTANPAHPAVAERVVEVCEDLLERYPLDGLHLDYIRYADRQFSEDPVSNQAYAEARAANPGLSRADWQRDQVTRLVQRVRDEALPVRPGARLTATAWPVYQDHWSWFRGNDGYSAMYQDSQRWAREGLVAGITPMTYGMTLDAHPDRFEILTRDYVEGSRPGGVIAGIGADYASFAEIEARIDIAREAGADGQALFSFRALEEHGHWAALGSGPYSEPAVPGWRE
jgi:uncharacterized lipoprotein YddW (UPF0748 family)